MFPASRSSKRCSRLICWRLVSILLILIHLSAAETKDSGNLSKNKKNSKHKSPSRVISLAESINRSQKSLQDPERARASREQWQRALKEIKELALDTQKVRKVKQTTSEDEGSFTKWKLLLDEPKAVKLDTDTEIAEVEESVTPLTGEKTQTSRFEGFASWERMLQDWAEDVQDYLEKVEAENSEYPLSSYGIPSSKRDEETNSRQSTHETPKENHHRKILDSTHNVTIVDEEEEIPRTKRSKINLPVPAAAVDGEPILPHTDIADKSKRIWIVTTAALPWMTGTAVNPLLRAAYMTEGRTEAGGSVTLMLPWLERKQDRDAVYGTSRSFDTSEEQEAFIREWLADKAKLEEASKRLKIEWYTSWQNKAENSLYSMGDITALIPSEEVDIMILEEPEHLNWYRAPGEAWTSKFKHVVGIVHTNYFVYAQDQPAAFIRAPGMRLLCSWMCRAHCHRLIKLSGTLGRFAPEKELVENVHGVRASFLETGVEVRQRLKNNATGDLVFGAEADPTVYFIGKMLWSKGLGSLMELLKYAEESAGIKIHVDMYGGGPDKDAAEAKADSLDVDMDFLGPIDHGELGFTHKIFINPSTSEVLTTTTAEALAMGKFVVLPSHPSNDFFAQFSNCLTYSNKEEFVGNLYYALTHSPEPLSTEEEFTLSWEAATQRLEAAGSIPVREAELMAEALNTKEAGIEIALPSLIEDQEDRELILQGLRRTRKRYRQFRSRLSQEISHSNVLPSRLKRRLTNELGKRLDFDLDELVEPKLELQLSPAELDKRLLELYESVAKGPGGDLLRVIGGGQDVAFQNLYIKRHVARERRKETRTRSGRVVRPQRQDMDEGKPMRTASQWVQRSLQRNLPKRNHSNSDLGSIEAEDASHKQSADEKPTMKMCQSAQHRPFAIALTSRNHFCPPRRASQTKLSLLI